MVVWDFVHQQYDSMTGIKNRELREWKGQESCSRVFLQLKLTAQTWRNLPKKETMINNGCSPVPNLLVAVIISCKEATISYKCTPQKSNITKNSHVLKGVTFSKPSTLEHGSHPIAFPPNTGQGHETDYSYLYKNHRGRKTHHFGYPC